MQIFLVGGAVRDEILGIPVKERDWVVVGATAEELLKKGFKCVGKEFPVFLHPKTQEEYALARTEQKSGKGYRGFVVDASQCITLIDDLSRRDLTINAIAKDEHGRLIDPFHGREDIQQKILRHVSPAFAEDPVRLLRVARFMARYYHRGFRVHEDTFNLMQAMVEAGEIDALVPERVFRELSRALQEPHPEQFFTTLEQSHALQRLFPEIAIEGKGMQALTQFAQCNPHPLPVIAFALLVHDVSATDHSQLCQRYRVPNDYKILAQLLQRHWQFLLSDVAQQWQKMPDAAHAEPLLDFFMRVDGFRRKARFHQLLHAASQLAASKNTEFDVKNWEDAYTHASEINIQTLLSEGFQGETLVKAIYQERLKKLIK